MRINLGSEPQSVEREVTGAFGSFFITLRAITGTDRARSRHFFMREEFDELAKLRSGMVIGWREITDHANAPIPFNSRNLELVCAANAAIDGAIQTSVADYFRENLTLIEDVEKN